MTDVEARQGSDSNAELATAFRGLAQALGLAPDATPSRVVLEALRTVAERDALLDQNGRLERQYEGAIDYGNGLSVTLDAMRQRDEILREVAGIAAKQDDAGRLLFEKANELQALRKLLTAVLVERGARIAWLASLPANACKSPPPTSLRKAEAATKKAVDAVILAIGSKR